MSRQNQPDSILCSICRAEHQTVCCTTLAAIRQVLNDHTLSDFECIEKIVCLLEDIGSNGGIRHDFG